MTTHTFHLGEFSGADAAKVRLAATGNIVDAISNNESPARTISYVFSDESVARDGHTISADGWELGNFQANPVFLWCHDSSAPPIGRVTSIARVGRKLAGTVEYLDESYPFADMIYRMTKSGFMNATSISWLAIEWEKSADPSRQGGINFKRQELLEISAVPVPALPTALATARAAGIDTGPMYHWAEKILDTGAMIMVPRVEIETLRREAKMLKKIPPAAAAKPEAPAAVPMARKAIIGKSGKALSRSLYEVSAMAYEILSLEYLFDQIEAEANWEGDNSDIPARFRAWLDEGNKILADMCAEETAENIADAGDDGDAADVAAMVERGITRALAKVNLARAGKTLSGENVKALESIHDRCAETTTMMRGFIDAATASEPETKPETRENDASSTQAMEAALALRERKAKARARAVAALK